ncbi:MAG TPA: ABC transporter substrate-binding protein [Solirubrobacteraceae bacterium]
MLTCALASALLVAGCGGSSSGQRRAGEPPAMMLMATAPNSLDPAAGNNPEALEVDWLVYTPLLTYAHVTGVIGTHVIPGLAETLPGISGGGRIYSLTLRPGLKYSSGQPVRATDFTLAVERAIKLWSGAAQITSRVAGASAFAHGRAKAISGIAANDSTGQITITLTAPDGTFENLLALPSLAPVPAGTPFTNEQTPPPGLGPYTFGAVDPGRSFSLIDNEGWAKLGVQGVPAARLDVDVRVTGDAAANAQSVLNGSADVFDWPDQIPAGQLAEIKGTASSRYFPRAMLGSELIFLNVTSKPFSNQLAREAVRAGLDQNTMAKLDGGMLRTGCYVLLPSMFGHPNSACPDGNKAGDGDLSVARNLVKNSGMAGTRVTVWSQTTSPVRQWMTYYTSLLNQIGFDATLKLVPDHSYYATIGDPRAGAQTGYGALYQELPNPADPYGQLTGQGNEATADHNWSQLDDPTLKASVRALTAIPASTIGAVADDWRQLELDVADNAYVAPFGYPTFPEFVSSRIDFRALIFSPVAGYDLSSLRLK